MERVISMPALVENRVVTAALVGLIAWSSASARSADAPITSTPLAMENAAATRRESHTLTRQEIFEASHNIILKTSSEMAAARREGAGDHFTTSNDLVGFLVDAIGDVVEADESTIEPPSANVSEAEGRFLSGVIKTDGGLLVLLDIREVLHGE